MEQILSRDGKVIQRSRNMRGIRHYVTRNKIKQLHIRSINNYGGELVIFFENGATFTTVFSSYCNLVQVVQRWRGVYGAELWICGKVSGTVNYRHTYLSARLGYHDGEYFIC